MLNVFGRYWNDSGFVLGLFSVMNSNGLLVDFAFKCFGALKAYRGQSFILCIIVSLYVLCTRFCFVIGIKSLYRYQLGMLVSSFLVRSFVDTAQGIFVLHSLVLFLQFLVLMLRDFLLIMASLALVCNNCFYLFHCFRAVFFFSIPNSVLFLAFFLHHCWRLVCWWELRSFVFNFFLLTFHEVLLCFFIMFFIPSPLVFFRIL